MNEERNGLVQPPVERFNSVLLALDTATTTASLAVYDLDSGRLLAEETWEARRRQTQDLLVAATTLLAQSKLVPADLRALAVTTGPGSFTGVRIGISSVKGIGLGLAARPAVVGVPTLSVTAAPWIGLLPSEDAAVCALIEAGRGRYNWVYFGPGQRLWRPDVAAHHVGKVGDLAQSLSGQRAPIWLVGELATEVASMASTMAHVRVVDRVSGLRRAGHLASLAAEHLAAGNADSLNELQPLYLRTP